MIQVNTSIVLANNTVKTILELLQAAIAARTYPSQPQEDAEVSHYGGGVHINEGFFRPVGSDVYMMDAYKGVLNGVADATLLAADFTNAPGGGELVTADTEKHFNFGLDLGSRVLFQNSGGNVTIYLDFSFN